MYTKESIETFLQNQGRLFDEEGAASYEEAEEYILGIPNYKSLTNLSLGLGEAEELVESNSGRETTVIFISDAR